MPLCTVPLPVPPVKVQVVVVQLTPAPVKVNAPVVLLMLDTPELPVAHPTVVSVPPVPLGQTGLVLDVPKICERFSRPLALPSGIPAHVPGVPAATLTHPAIPFASAPEFCSVSPWLQASAVGIAADFVGICTSNPNTGAENESAVAVV